MFGEREILEHKELGVEDPVRLWTVQTGMSFKIKDFQCEREQSGPSSRREQRVKVETRNRKR